MTRPRRPRLTALDIENISDALGFALAGEYPFDDPDLTEEENRQRHESFERTYSKIARSG